MYNGGDMKDCLAQVGRIFAGFDKLCVKFLNSFFCLLLDLLPYFSMGLVLYLMIDACNGLIIYVSPAEIDFATRGKGNSSLSCPQIPFFRRIPTCLNAILWYAL